MLRHFRRILLPGIAVLGLVMLARRTVSLRRELEQPPPSPDPWTPIAPRPLARWVEANTDRTCPSTHPIKAKAASGIYHLPGMFAYQRTNPDRCYADEAAAVADGFTKAKR
jgi:hypothetical protein